MKRHWTESDFDSLGWHDVHAHGWRIAEAEYGTGILSLEIDYILEWIQPQIPDSCFRFRIAPAVLEFREVSNLRMIIDYANPCAAIGPFSLDGIERETITYPTGSQSYKWTIDINWPSGDISFESPGFSMSLCGPSIETHKQYLDKSTRSR